MARKKLYSVVEVSDKLGLAVRTVQKHCLDLGLRRVGHAYLLDMEDIKKIRAIAHEGRGRPREVS